MSFPIYWHQQMIRSIWHEKGSSESCRSRKNLLLHDFASFRCFHSQILVLNIVKILDQTLSTIIWRTLSPHKSGVSLRVYLAEPQKISINTLRIVRYFLRFPFKSDLRTLFQELENNDWHSFCCKQLQFRVSSIVDRPLNHPIIKT
jgi:uncharacterized membrane protein YheB (UPF0754 family)